MMATQQFTGQALVVGQWVNLDTMLRIGFAGRPARVIEVKPKSIVAEEAIRDLRTGYVEIDQPKIKRLTNITFVSDTMEEAESMMAASRAFTNAEFQIERELKKAAGARKAAAIGAALTPNHEITGPSWSGA